MKTSGSESTTQILDRLMKFFQEVCQLTDLDVTITIEKVSIKISNQKGEQGEQSNRQDGS